MFHSHAGILRGVESVCQVAKHINRNELLRQKGRGRLSALGTVPSLLLTPYKRYFKSGRLGETPELANNRNKSKLLYCSKSSVLADDIAHCERSQCWRPVGIGIYAKASRNPDTGAVTPVADLETLAVEVFQRLGVSASVQVGSSVSGRSVASKDAKICVKGSRRIRRKLSLGARSVVYVNELTSSRKAKSSVRRHPKTGALIIPKSGLRRYVMDLADSCQAAYVRTYADEWAESVSRLAGDDVRTDVIENRVIALKKEKKVTGLEAVHLLANYLREKQRV